MLIFGNMREPVSHPLPFENVFIKNLLINLKH
jgi:hypothetical protein